MVGVRERWLKVRVGVNQEGGLVCGAFVCSMFAKMVVGEGGLSSSYCQFG